MRNFICPESDEPCRDSRCKKGVLCCEEERRKVEERALESASLERLLNKIVRDLSDEELRALMEEVKHTRKEKD
jgi:hypothetical protein